VEINSGTKNVAGVNQVQEIIEAEMKKLGLATAYVPNPVDAAKSGKFLIGTLPGVDEKRYVTLIAHADTVFEPASGFTAFSLDEDGKIARGPGVADDKGGLVIGIAALKKYMERNPGKPVMSIRFISAPSEEDGGGTSSLCSSPSQRIRSSL
jgi:glutamate carboxypeptidase